MKFLCDRCKTRYSIGDDRVRGKILKIRCKNCANVITVREGMTDVEADAGRRHRPTTGAPPVSTSSTQGALGAAFAKQMTKPPPALEEEWYVSIDGEQAGPFSLSEAQRWVGSKPFEAELHCWSEGFDDWLPVDKVSHFRGLRKAPAPAAMPPPLPRVAPKRPQPAVAAAPARVEDTPKPLFAATMAALERSVEQQPPRANGTGTASAIASATPIPTIAKGNTGPLAKLPAPATMKGPGLAARGPTAQGMGAVSPGAKALAEAFDVRPADPADSATAIEAPAFNDEISTNAEPVSGKRTRDMMQEVARPKATPTAPADPAAPMMDDEDLQIGEVSRVVKLADIAKMAAERSQDRSSPRVRTGRTASVPKYPAADIPGALAPVAAGVPGMASVAPPILASESTVAGQPHRIQRRGLYMLLGAAALLVTGVVIAVVVLFSNNDGDEPTALREQQQYDTNRPDDPTHPRNAIEAVASTGALGSSVAPRIIRRPQQFTTTRPQEPEIPSDPTKSRLRPEEIEDMASKQGDGTKRCYMRAQKGALGLEVGDVKKIDVMLTVDKEGAVTDVQLSDHGADPFGKCLIARIRGWKFRQSPGGVFKIALAFSSG